MHTVLCRSAEGGLLAAGEGAGDSFKACPGNGGGEPSVFARYVSRVFAGRY